MGKIIGLIVTAWLALFFVSTTVERMFARKSEAVPPEELPEVVQDLFAFNEGKQANEYPLPEDVGAS